ncbi:MAG: VOC family protein [Planctomycetota bacterium]|jgi:hypothetical protein
MCDRKVRQALGNNRSSTWDRPDLPVRYSWQSVLNVIRSLVFLSLATALPLACHEDEEGPYYEEQDVEDDYGLVNVSVDPDGNVRVIAPFTDVRVERHGRVRVQAPGTNVDTGPEDSTPTEFRYNVRIDHVTIAGRDLDRMRRMFDKSGLGTVYGGHHANGLTHMAILGFDDGSYVELVSAVDPDDDDLPLWERHIEDDGGPCSWAARSVNVDADAQRLADDGIPVRGPFTSGELRPDGSEAKWMLAFLGKHPPGAVLPILIEDLTPRDLRVTPSASVSGGPLIGVDAVVIGVENLDEAIDGFRRAFRWSAPWVLVDDEFGARLAFFEGTPVILATPVDDDGWLEERLDDFGDAPVAYLLGTTDIEAASRRFDLRPSVNWFDRPIAWFSTAQLRGTRLGVIQ